MAKVKGKFNCILASVDWSRDDAEEQVTGVNRFCDSASNVFTLTQMKFDTKVNNEISLVRDKSPRFRDSVGQHIFRLRGQESIVFANTDTIFVKDTSALDKFIEDNINTQNYVLWQPNDKSGLFDFIIASIPILHVIYNDIPANLAHSGDDWKWWLNDKLISLMQGSKIYDITNLALLEAPASKEEPKPVKTKKKA